MQFDFKFSIITAFYNTQSYIKESIDSVINQTFDFKDNIQLILIDDGSTDDSKTIALSYQEKFPDNIIVLDNNNKNPSSSRNLGLKHATGEYVNFLDSDDKLSLNCLEVIYNYFNDNPNVNIASIPLIFLGSDEEDLLLEKYDYNQIIDVYKDYTYPQLSISSCFIKKDILDDYSFDERLMIREDALLVNEILTNEGKYALVNDAKYYFRIRPDESALSDTLKSQKAYFNDRVDYFYKQLIDYSIDKKGFLPDFIKYGIAYDVSLFFSIPTSNVLTKSEYIEFRDMLQDALSYIDDDIIINHKFIPETVKSLLIYLKNNEFHIDVQSNEVSLYHK